LHFEEDNIIFIFCYLKTQLLNENHVLYYLIN